MTPPSTLFILVSRPGCAGCVYVKKNLLKLDDKIQSTVTIAELPWRVPVASLGVTVTGESVFAPQLFRRVRDGVYSAVAVTDLDDMIRKIAAATPSDSNVQDRPVVAPVKGVKPSVPVVPVVEKRTPIIVGNPPVSARDVLYFPDFRTVVNDADQARLIDASTNKWRRLLQPYTGQVKLVDDDDGQSTLSQSTALLPSMRGKKSKIRCRLPNATLRVSLDAVLSRSRVIANLRSTTWEGYGAVDITIASHLFVFKAQSRPNAVVIFQPSSLDDTNVTFIVLSCAPFSEVNVFEEDGLVHVRLPNLQVRLEWYANRTTTNCWVSYPNSKTTAIPSFLFVDQELPTNDITIMFKNFITQISNDGL